MAYLRMYHTSEVGSSPTRPAGVSETVSRVNHCRPSVAK